MNTQVFNKLEFDYNQAELALKLLATEVHIAAESPDERTNWFAARYDVRLRKLAEYFAAGHRDTNNTVYKTISGFLASYSQNHIYGSDCLDLDAATFTSKAKQAAKNIQTILDLCVSELGE